MNERIKLLKEALNVLRSPADAQLEHLVSLGLPNGIDELALEFDDIAGAAEDMLECGELNQSQYDSVKKLSDLISKISGQHRSELWTTAALFLSEEWKAVRKLANECLRLFHTS